MNPRSLAEARIETEALQWFTRARAADFSSQERQQLAAWLEADERHRREYELLLETWDRLDVLKSHFTVAKQQRTEAGLMRRQMRGAIAACLLIAVTAVLYRLSFISYESAPGNLRSVQIADGIEVELDADSEIRVSRLSERPDITLVRGSVYFDVTARHSGLRVRVADATLRDIGTRFAVSLAGDGGRLSVAEGAVEIGTETEWRMLKSAQKARFSSERIGMSMRCDPQLIAPWRRGEYRFEAASLAEVADAIWRHNQIRVEISEAETSALTVSGNFAIAQPDKLLWAISQIHNLYLTENEDGYTLSAAF